MAASKTPIRSISLPSRLHSANSTGFESEIQKLKSLPITFDAIQPAILNLAEIFISVQEVIQSPSAQESLVGISMEESILNGSINLIDSCGTIRELFQMVKENVQSLQSALRRKGTRDLTIQSEVTSYFCFRKKMSTSIAKILEKLKKMENRIKCPVNSDEYVTRVLREATEVTIAVFRNILLFLSSPKANKNGGWDLVSRFIVTKSRAWSGDKKILGVMGSVDFALVSLQGSLRDDSVKVLVEGRISKQSLKDLDVCIQGLEEGLDTLFRQLIRCRVTLLNILTDQ